MAFGLHFGRLLGVLWVPIWELRGSFWSAVGSLGDRRGLFWRPVGVPWGCFVVPGGSYGVSGRLCGVLGRAGGARRETPGNSGSHFGFMLGQKIVIFRDIFGLRFLIDFRRDFGWILGAFWKGFWSIFLPFSNSAKNAAPHESAAYNNQIVGRAPCKMSEKAFQNEEKHGMETMTKQ